MIHRKLRLFSGTSNPPLAQAISEAIGTPLGDISIRRFSDGEIYLQYGETIRGKDVFFIQPTSALANTNLMELLIAIDAAKRASARQICAVTPYFGYARQDRKSSGRTPITAKLVADMIEVAGATRVLTMDLHAGQIQGFFNIPVDNIYAAPLFARDIQERNELEKVTIVSPDVGGVVRARALAKRLHVDMAIVDKRRPAPNEAEVMNIIGDVEGKHCILVDDMVDTAGTLCNAAHALVERGASKVTAYATHGVLSGPAADRLEATDSLHELVITDTILQPDRILKLGKVRILSAAPLLAETITRIYDARSISSLYN